MGVITNVTTGAKAVLDAVMAANPTLLVQTYSARPAAIGSLPCAWVDDARFTIQSDAGLRIWNPGEVDIWLCPGGFDNEDWSGAADILTDLILDGFTDTPHFAGTNTSGGDRMAVRSGTVDAGNGVTFPAVIITVGGIYAQEGRT